MRTKDEMYEDIRNWEMDAGEDFLDYFGSSLNEFNFMFWCLGKGYITEEQLRSFDLLNHHGTEFLYGDEEYSVVKKGDNYSKGLEKAYKILANFLSSTETYQRRVDEFLKNVTKLKFEDVLKYIDRENLYYVLKGQEPVYVDSKTSLTIDIISRAVWYRDDSED